MKPFVFLTLPAEPERVSEAPYLIAGILALAVLAYLVYAMLKPEKF